MAPSKRFQRIFRTAIAAGLLFGMGTAAPPALAADACTAQGWIRTHAYWGNHPGLSWPDGYDRNTRFFRSDLTWQQVLDNPVRGDAYFTLAHQYIAAALNVGGGMAAPGSLRALMVAVKRWFESAAPGSCGQGGCPLQRSWARVLDEYNNGEYPGASKYCHGRH